MIRKTMTSLSIAAAYFVALSAFCAPAIKELERQAWLTPSHNLHEIETQLVRLIQHEPRSSEAHMLLSQTYLRMFSAEPADLQYLSLANSLAQQAMDLDPNKDFGYLALANVLDTMGNPERGLAMLEDIIALGIQPTWRYYLTKARLMNSTHNPSTILGFLKTSISFIDADREVIAPYIIAIVEGTNHGQQLVSSLETWNAQFPTLAFNLSLAQAHASGDRSDLALKAYESVLDQDPHHREALVNAAVLLYDKLSQPDRAKSMLQSVLSTSPDPRTKAFALAHLGVVNLKSKNFAQANRDFVASTKSTSNHQTIVEFIIQKYQKEDAPKPFTDLLASLSESAPGISLVHAIRAETLSAKLNLHEESLTDFLNAITLEPSRSEYYNGMGLAYYRMKEYPKALQMFSTAGDINPTNATARYNEACMFALMYKQDQALAALEEALSLDPELVNTAVSDTDLDNIRGMKMFRKLVPTKGLAH